MGCLFLLQGIFLTEELNLGLLGFLLWPVAPGKPICNYSGD